MKQLKPTMEVPASFPQAVPVTMALAKSGWRQPKGRSLREKFVRYPSPSDHYSEVPTINIPKLNFINVATLKVTKCQCGEYQPCTH